jgi:hypothetical protein
MKRLKVLFLIIVLFVFDQRSAGQIKYTYLRVKFDPANSELKGFFLDIDKGIKQDSAIRPIASAPRQNEGV